MTMLHDRLAELAEEAPAALPAPGLWERGRRYARVRRTGTAAIVAAACLALVVLSGVTWLQSTPPSRPAPAGSPVVLPGRIWQPSPWLPGTDSDGPLGQLVAAVAAERGGWTGKHPGVVGISATTGEYRFLDLPAAAFAEGLSAPALSPDGRHVAYWLTGATEGSANGTPVVGVAVYDTSTGQVRRHLIPTEHGLGPEVLVWADATTLVFSAGQIVGGPEDSEMDQSSVRSGDLSAWRLDAALPEPLPVGGFDGYDVESTGHGRLLLREGDGGHLVLVLDDPDPMRRFVILRDTSTDPVLDAAGEQVAVVFGGSKEPGVSGRNPNVVLAGPVVSRGPGEADVAELAQVPHSRLTRVVVGWLDETHLAAVRFVGRNSRGTALFRLSVATGAAEQMVRLPAEGFGGTTQFATDLLDAPSVRVEQPQSPLDPRLVAGLVLATAGVTVWALVRWRRRVQP